jgi:two-component system sensor histidine kinase KdpD
MNGLAWRLFRIAGCIFFMWLLARTAYAVLPEEDEVGAMVLLLCVLASATMADRSLAVAASLSAGLSFNYYYIGPALSLRLSSMQDAVNVGAFIIVALTGSHLSLSARQRAQDSERRREEMERLQRFSAALLSAGTVSDAAERVVREIVSLFGGGAVLLVAGLREPFRAGNTDSTGAQPLVLHTPNQNGRLELHGMEPSVEVGSALVNLIGLVLDRAAAAEARSRVESTQRGEQLRNTILNALAHNFKTPLTCIKAAASMMRGSAETPGSYSQELVEVIDEEADRLDSLIRDSLDLARIQSRQENPRIEDCTVGSIVSGVLEKMKRYLARHRVVVSVPDDLPMLRGDRFLFEQMIGQILDNVWKYAAAGSHVWISAWQSGSEVVLTIRNEGPQIPEEERSLIFDRFYRGARSRASVEGTGLGLAITKTIVEVHGGRVWLQAAQDGPEFCFALPAEPMEKGKEHDREPHYIAD